MRFNYFIVLIIFFSPLSLYSDTRFICNSSSQTSIKLITNFYILDKMLVMSGAAGSGEYKILYKTEDGLLAINSSYIGKEFGLETILINKKNKTFLYKTFINREKNNSIVELKGDCNLAN